jgi:hypothetical protein
MATPGRIPHLEELMPGRPGARSLARQLFGNFVGVLLLSLIALIPGQGHEALGAEFTLAGLLGVATTLARIRRIGLVRGRRRQ